MKTREEALKYGLSLPDTYQNAPFHDDNWQLVRVKESKKVFLWTYEREGYINLNVKTDPEWRDFWRSAYDAVIPGWHQNKAHWNTIICYRVVNAKGELSGAFAFGGADEQEKRLEADGIRVVNGKVDLNQYGYQEK